MNTLSDLRWWLIDLLGGAPAMSARKTKVKVVSYGRTIECGQFGRGPTGKVWFGGETEVADNETEDDALARLRAKADALEKEEREFFHEREPRAARG